MNNKEYLFYPFILKKTKKYRIITASAFFAFTLLLLLPLIFSGINVIAQTMTINNITGVFKNATGSTIIKDTSQMTNTTTMIKNDLLQISNDSHKKEESRLTLARSIGGSTTQEVD